MMTWHILVFKTPEVLHLEAQEKTQDIKQSPSMTIGTKLYVRSRRNELIEVTRRWTGCWQHSDRTPDQEAQQQ